MSRGNFFFRLPPPLMVDIAWKTAAATTALKSASLSAVLFDQHQWHHAVSISHYVKRCIKLRMTVYWGLNTQNMRCDAIVFEFVFCCITMCLFRSPSIPSIRSIPSVYLNSHSCRRTFFLLRIIGRASTMLSPTPHSPFDEYGIAYTMDTAMFRYGLNSVHRTFEIVVCCMYLLLKYV